MNAPLWAVELAADFWCEAGGPEPFPRTLRAAIDRSSFDLTVEELPDLTVAVVERYLARRGCARSCSQVDRPLRGCLTAENGSGYLFVDAPTIRPSEPFRSPTSWPTSCAITGRCAARRRRAGAGDPRSA